MGVSSEELMNHECAHLYTEYLCEPNLFYLAPLILSAHFPSLFTMKYIENLSLCDFLNVFVFSGRKFLTSYN